MKTIHIALFIAISLVASTVEGHSGRTGKDGCHAGSQPHHCHGGTTKRPSAPQSRERVCIYVYRYSDGSPAYIGISNNPQKRWGQHSDDGRPFASMSKSVTSCHNSRREALRVERELILKHCRPRLFNKTHCN